MKKRKKDYEKKKDTTSERERAMTYFSWAATIISGIINLLLFATLFYSDTGILYRQTIQIPLIMILEIGVIGIGQLLFGAITIWKKRQRLFRYYAIVATPIVFTIWITIIVMYVFPFEMQPFDIQKLITITKFSISMQSYNGQVSFEQIEAFQLDLKATFIAVVSVMAFPIIVAALSKIFKNSEHKMAN